MKMEQTECPEKSAYKIRTPGNYPEESIQNHNYVTKLADTFDLRHMPSFYVLVAKERLGKEMRIKEEQYKS
jgi:hypothetical protein